LVSSKAPIFAPYLTAKHDNKTTQAKINQFNRLFRIL